MPPEPSAQPIPALGAWPPPVKPGPSPAHSRPPDHVHPPVDTRGRARRHGAEITADHAVARLRPRWVTIAWRTRGPWRGRIAAECDALEKRSVGSPGLVGSNPTPSADDTGPLPAAREGAGVFFTATPTGSKPRGGRRRHG